MEDGAWGSDEAESPDDPAVTAAAATVADIVDASSGVAALAEVAGAAAAGGGRTYRPSATRPVLKLSVSLIDTYKQINKIYYDARARQREAEAEDGNRGGMYNNGYDDQHYDYILHADEVFAGRYILKHKIGKGSFGQVVCAWDQESRTDVAIKIIKSRRPFLAQALTEIDLLTRILDRDENDDFNVVRLVQKFNYRNHQCLVFEMLSYNLYELLKNTKFFGVSLNLIRKFSKQILRALEFLARPDVDIIHCDLKPENILLRHPRRSAIKLIDFGSSCLTTERKYSYIQSRFYRSPEVLLGLPYDQQIDMWSLGCLLVEMHTGEPLFGGTDQADQMCRIVDVLGMPPLSMLEASPAATRATFFERVDTASGAAPSPECDPAHRVNVDAEGAVYYLLRRTQRDAPRQQSLADIIGAYIGGPFGRRKDHDGHTEDKYVEFLEFIRSMLIFDPAERASAVQALQHPYLVSAAAPRGDEASQGGHSTAVTLGGSVRSGAGGQQATERDAADAEAGSKRSGREHSAPQGHQRIRSRSAPTSTKAQSASPNVRGDEMDQEPPPGV